jgi:CRP-like cAMP-binding protein
MAHDQRVHDSRRPFESIAQRVGVDVQWTDLAGQVALGMDRWVGSYLPHADVPGHEDALEAPFLAGGHPEDWERLERYAVCQRFRAGDEIIRLGHGERSLIIVRSGQLSLIVVNNAGDEHVLDVAGARSLVGEIGFFDPGGLSVAVRARGDGELLRLSLSRFEALAASCPLLGRTILLEAGRIAVSRLRRQVMALTSGGAARDSAARDSATRDSATRDSATRDSATRDSATRIVGQA